MTKISHHNLFLLNSSVFNHFEDPDSKVTYYNVDSYDKYAFGFSHLELKRILELDSMENEFKYRYDYHLNVKEVILLIYKHEGPFGDYFTKAFALNTTENPKETPSLNIIPREWVQ